MPTVLIVRIALSAGCDDVSAETPRARYHKPLPRKRLVLPPELGRAPPTRTARLRRRSTLAHLTGKSARRGTALRLVLPVRLVIARCSVDHAGRLSACLPLATRVIMLKADDRVSIHSDRDRTSRLNNTGRDHASL